MMYAAPFVMSTRELWLGLYFAFFIGFVLGGFTVAVWHSRGTIGDPRALTAINDTQTKLFKLSEFCGVGISGGSEFAAKAIDELRGKLTDEQYADEILTKTRSVMRELFDDWFEKFNPQARPALSLTLVGYAKNNHVMTPRTLTFPRR
jgi:hypothetical protein